MRVILFFLLVIVGAKASWGQAVVPVSRTAWNAGEPTGWTNSGCSPRTTISACSGSDATIFDNSGDFRIVFYNSPASQLVFKLKSAGMSGASSLLVQESVDGVTYTSIGTYGTAGGATAITDCGNITITLNCLSRYIKWTYTKSTGNCDMDDVSITQGTCTSCTAPTTTLSSTSQTICSGSVASFSVGTNASPTPTYTWQASATSGGVYSTVADGTPAGATYGGTANSNSLTISGGSTYFYKCLVSEASSTCVATSSTASLTVNSAATVSAPPSRTVCSGVNTTFTTTPSAGATLQWQYSSTGATFTNVTVDGVHTNVTSATLNLTAPTTTLNGYIYRCVATNTPCSAVNSATAMLTVVSIPATPPTPIPSSSPACSSATLAAMTTTVAGVTWYWETTPAGVLTTTNTSSAYILGAGTNQNMYVRAFSDVGGCKSVALSTINIDVNTPPTATAPPSKTVCAGTNTTIAVTASAGSTKVWYYSNDGGITFTVVPSDGTHFNMSTASLSIAATPSTLNGYVYYCEVSVAGCSAVNSATALLTVVNIPATPPSLIPSSNPACSSLTFAAMTSTVAGVTWYWETTPAGVLTASNTSSPYVNSLIGTNDFFVRAISDIGNCPSAASSITVDVNSPVTIGTQPTSKSICSGTSTSFSISGIAGTVPRQWQYSNDNGVTFTNTPVDAVHSTGTVSTINLTSVPISLTGYVYRIVVSQPGCTDVISNTATLTVNNVPADPPAPTALVSPACNSTSLAAMSSTVAGVTWYWEGASSTSTSTTNQTNVNSPTINSSGTYYVRAVAGACSSVNSSSVAVTILTNPAVSAQPSSYTVASIGTAYFTASVTGGNMSYQWYEDAGSGFVAITDGSVIPTYAGATTSVLAISNPPVSMSGYTYQCIATNMCNNVTTNGAAKMYVGTGTNTCTIGGALGTGYTFGCGNGASACNLNSVYSAYGTFCSTSAIACGVGCNPVSRSTSITLQAGCTASIVAEYKNRTNVTATTCANAAMDGGDQLYITNSGGSIISQSANLSGCGAFSTTTISTISNGCGNGDGIVTMNITGGQVTIGGVMDRGDEIITYTVNLTGTCANNCPVTLPISLVDFYGVQDGDKNDVIWKVAAEENIMSYLVEKSTNGAEFIAVDHLLPSEPSSEIKKYMIEDLTPYNGITYYRLSTLETDWSIKYYPIISLDRNSKDIKPVFIQSESNLTVEFKNVVPKNSTVSIIDITGKEIVSKQLTETSISFNKEAFANGLYFVKITSPYKTENFKIVIQK